MMGIGAVTIDGFLIANFRHVLYVVWFLLGNSPASEYYMMTFQNTLGECWGIYMGKGLTSAIGWLTLTCAVSPSHMHPWPPCGSLPSTACFSTQTCPYPVTLLPIG